MRTRKLVVATVWMAASAACYGAQECEPKVESVVVVHLENLGVAPTFVLVQAKTMVADMFAGIGVRLEWQEGVPHAARLSAPCTAQASKVLELRFDERAAARFPEDAMAYAVPGKTGVCIHIFYARVAAATTHRLTPVLLAHVLAHEITHVLEGVARHSENGVMKAHWNSRDYQQMSDHPLPFAEEDVQLVRAHLAGLP